MIDTALNEYFELLPEGFTETLLGLGLCFLIVYAILSIFFNDL